MRDTTGLRELVEQHKRQTGENHAFLAAVMGVSEPTFHYKLTGQAPIKLREGVKLARALGVLCGEA